MQALLAVGVLGILRAIALRGGLGDRRGDARAFVVPQLVEFIAQPLGAFGGDVLASRAGWVGDILTRCNKLWADSKDVNRF